MPGNSVYDFVISSSVRVDILQRLAATTQPTDQLIDHLDASTSTVYTALADLERRGVVFDGDAGWTLTGQGRLVVDLIERKKSTVQTINYDQEYWETHRTDHLPREFRRRLPELGQYEVVRSEPPTVRAHASAVVDLLEQADSCRTAVPIHAPEYSDAFPDDPDSRLILPPSVVDQLQADVEAGTRDRIREIDTAQYRVTDIQFGFTVADSYMMMALRPMTQSPVESVLISEAESAIRWASDLYESLWQDAERLDSYLSRG
ncbi:putative transcriptional regulator [Halohasta litchfieldiae]|jgi:predicted transcriptional regulator|uniref:Predicted transcriptional regulator, contains HTH domain n=1 Tax=Halohasta litchfieldiae TaxID=1073996 RepID=A0A1H6RTQ5_9EURY|nr:putative transcriptional regulator [Halohasta litchfieldiae]SEI59129.1 Predicted transcriptional regulator, contains HTH domain [Halohasta litchfieldiae]